MTHHILCPYCGHNFEADAPVRQDGWLLDHYAGRASWRGVNVTDRVTWVRILHTVALAQPNIVTVDALLNRVSTSERPNTIHSMVSQMRRQWPAKVPWPLEGVHGHGCRWIGEGVP